MVRVFNQSLTQHLISEHEQTGDEASAKVRLRPEDLERSFRERLVELILLLNQVELLLGGNVIWIIRPGMEPLYDFEGFLAPVLRKKPTRRERNVRTAR